MSLPDHPLFADDPEERSEIDDKCEQSSSEDMWQEEILGYDPIKQLNLSLKIRCQSLVQAYFFRTVPYTGQGANESLDAWLKRFKICLNSIWDETLIGEPDDKLPQSKAEDDDTPTWLNETVNKVVQKIIATKPAH